MTERGTTRAEVEYTVKHGDRSPAKYRRTCFTHTFSYNRKWLGAIYTHKKVGVYAAETAKDEWLVVTVVVQFFNRRARS
jgi:hypothetical protein